jgi:hypothetical protein
VLQPASGVVDEDEQGALRAAILEPPVFRAVDLDEFADAPDAGVTKWRLHPVLA